MNKTFTAIAAVGLLGAFCATGATVTGTITLKGNAPAEKPITPVKDDPTCGKLHTSVPTTKFYVVGDNNALADVVVSLEGVAGKGGAAGKAPVLDQKTCLYVPQIIAMQTGQKLTVKNSDPVMHNVHAQPTAGSGNKEQNMVQMAKGADLTFTFDKPEEFVKFKCDVHPWMFAWVSVFDHPYFAVSGQDGTFKIENVPPGKYKIKANHRKAGAVTQEIEVKDQDAKVQFVMDAK
jgi:plastocyanin